MENISSCGEESFLCLTFETLEEVIELNNSVEQGLCSTLFTQNMSSAFQSRWIKVIVAVRPFILLQIESTRRCADLETLLTVVNVNGSTSGAEIDAPFGGNATGWGRESGGDAWKQCCRWSSCTLNWSDQLDLAQGVKFKWGKCTRRRGDLECGSTG
ncbi:hypothetical protein RQP46_009759 [Phenoliferia psychrophenolica]